MTTLSMIFVDPFVYPFMQRALVASIMIGAVCAALSCFLVLKGWSLMGDAISHAVLPGIVLAYVLSIPLVIGAFIAGLSCAFSIGYLKENSRVKEDTVMGIVFSGMFALGLVLFTKIESDQHLLHILFGNMLGVTWFDTAEMAAIAIPTFTIIILKRRDFLLYCFDVGHARAIGLPVRALHFGLLALLALTIVAALKAVGIILVTAMLVAPGAIGFLITKSFDRMLAVAMASAIGSCVIGTVTSFHLDASTGPCIVVVQATLFGLALTWTMLRGNGGVSNELPEAPLA